MCDLMTNISQGEHQTQGFEIAADDHLNLARTCTAFGNTDGGSLFLGVKGNGKIVGCTPDEELKKIKEITEKYCEPSMEVTHLVHQEGFRLVLEINIEGNPKRPYKSPDEEGRLKAYFRNENHTLLANKIVTHIWQLEKANSLRPESIGEEEKTLLDSLREAGELTLSQLYRLCALPMNRIDHCLACLCHWSMVEMNIRETKTSYTLKEFL